MEFFSWDHIRAIQQIDIVNAIRKAGLLSISEIARLTGLNEAVVTDIAAQLIGHNLIYKKNAGSDQCKLVLRPDAIYVAGIRLTASDITCVIVDFLVDAKTVLQHPLETSDKAPAALAGLVEKVLRDCVENARLSLDRIAVVGISMSGLIDSKKKEHIRTQVQKRKEPDFFSRIQDRFKIPVMAQNHAVTAALACKGYGSGGCDDFILISLEDSVQMAVVFNGKVYLNPAGRGGEFGHMVIVPGGVACHCGKRGCIDAYVATASIVEAARRACDLKELTCKNPEQISFENLIEKGHAGIEVVEEIFRQAGNILGLGLSALVQIFCPARIIITGTGVGAGELLFSPMRETLGRHANGVLLKAVEIVFHAGQPIDSAKAAAFMALMIAVNTIARPN